MPEAWSERRGEVVEETARLILLCVESGEAQQPPPVVSGLDDLRVQQQAHLVSRSETSSTSSTSYPSSLSRRSRSSSRWPSPMVNTSSRVSSSQSSSYAVRTLAAKFEGIVDDVAFELRCEIVQLAGEVLLGDVEIVLPLAV